MKLSQLTKSIYHHVIVFGPSKAGKTKLVGDLSRAGFHLNWFDLENGIETLLQLPIDCQERINVFKIPDTKDFPVAGDTLTHVLKGNKTRICLNHGKVGCALCLKSSPGGFQEIHLPAQRPDEIFVIDSGTQWSNSVMSHIGRSFDDTWKPEWDHYRTQGAILDRGLSFIQNGGFNCVLITHEMEIDMEDGKKKLVPVMGSSNFSRNTAKYFGDVVYCEVKNRKHCAGSSTIYAPNILTGSRLGITIENDPYATLVRIFTNDSSPDQAKQILSELNSKLQVKG